MKAIFLIQEEPDLLLWTNRFKNFWSQLMQLRTCLTSLAESYLRIVSCCGLIIVRGGVFSVSYRMDEMKNGMIMYIHSACQIFIPGRNLDAEESVNLNVHSSSTLQPRIIIAILRIHIVQHLKE